jgi:methylenetetrahydrofolate--tRNA-(uracil-5-)-methyltransferase
MTSPRVTVIGGGFAGVECASALARRGHRVRLVEMRPVRTTDAHESDRLAEMVCSNSFRSDNPGNAVGLLKREMELLGSLVMEEARRAAVPAGDALAVDRELFARAVTARVEGLPLVDLVREEVEALPDPGDGFVVVATGPLTSPSLSGALLSALGGSHLYFYDAVAPIVEAASLDLSVLYAASRWGKGGGADYLNVPLSREEYEAFVGELLAGEKVPYHDFEKAVHFDGCLPIEAMAERGIETLRHGPMKPFGLRDPRTGREPYAAVQLRQDNLAKSHWNLVGFQTKLKVGEQRRVFRTLPGLANAEFVRYGMLHRNTFLNGPTHLDRLLPLEEGPARLLRRADHRRRGVSRVGGDGADGGRHDRPAPRGARAGPAPLLDGARGLSRHVSESDEAHYAPMNVTFGLIDDSEVPPIRDRGKRREEIARRALASVAAWREAALGTGAAPPGEGPGPAPAAAGSGRSEARRSVPSSLVPSRPPRRARRGRGAPEAIRGLGILLHPLSRGRRPQPDGRGNGTAGPRPHRREVAGDGLRRPARLLHPARARQDAALRPEADGRRDPGPRRRGPEPREEGPLTGRAGA